MFQTLKMHWKFTLLIAALLSTSTALRFDREHVISASNETQEESGGFTDSQTESMDQGIESSESDSSGEQDTSESRVAIKEIITSESESSEPPSAVASLEGNIVSDESAPEQLEEGVVETGHGRVRGHLLNGMRQYIDIPYGRISNVFQAPEEPVPWEDIHDVTEHDKRCPQLLEDGSAAGALDCLTLSVFAPAAPRAAAASVLFHIHDGNLRTGSGDPALYGPDRLVEKGLIVVLPNYRLGPLGFMCLDNEQVPGNAALKDLSLALKWTSENIASFGGNSNNIVVSGIGMAGALAGYLAVSPVSSAYISKAIASSGSVFSHWAIDRSPHEEALKLANVLAGEETEDTSILYETDWNDLIIGAKNLMFSPCVENSRNGFIVQSPWEIVHEGAVNITFMVGSANHAGLHEALASSYDPEAHDLRQLLPNDLRFEDGDEEMTEVALKIKSQYFSDNGDDSLTLYHTDASYLSPAIRFARCLVGAGASVYFYEFSYHGHLNIEALALPEPHVTGAVRGDIVGYVFKQEHTSATANDQNMARLMTDIWTNFINTGEPALENVPWPRLEASAEAEEKWLSIGSAVAARAGLHVQRLALWTEIYNEHFVESEGAANASASLFTIAFVTILTFAYKM